MIDYIAKRRLQQIRLCARVANRLGRTRPGRVGIQALQNNSITRALTNCLLGFHKPFASLNEAQRHIDVYTDEGHENIGNVLWHLSASETAWPSDYPALFHIRSRQDMINTVFDLGGNAGNIFYRYNRYINWPSETIWTVCDLPKNIEFGKSYAQERQERRLRFTTHPENLDGTDLLLASGSLHYFQNPVDIISAASKKPHFILVNRSPFTDAESYAVVQDVGDWIVACAIHNRRQIYDGLRKLGYEVLDEWSAAGFQIRVASSPALNVTSYSGFFAALSAPEKS